MDIKEFLVPRNPGYKEILDELTKLANERSMKFQKTEPYGWERDRVYFLMEGKSKFLIGFVTMPDSQREYDDRAFNCISENDRCNLKNYEGKQEGNKIYKCLVLQCWGRPYPVVIIPVKELENSPTFKRNGKFTIKKENDGFHLVDGGNPKIYFKEILDKQELDKIFNYLEDYSIPR
ncbi:MAG: hypothetical protein AAB019_07635 [Planctomycetota bacterium]|mgnify:CR=1 FL=1